MRCTKWSDINAFAGMLNDFNVIRMRLWIADEWELRQQLNHMIQMQ